MRKGKIRWGRLLRRGVALFLVTVAVWALTLAAGSWHPAGLFQTLGEDPELAVGLLRAELGAPEAGALDRWGRLLLGQSAYLDGGRTAVEARLSAVPNGPAGDGDSLSDLLSGSGEDLEQLPEVTAAPDDIVARTLIPSSTDGYEYADGVYVNNRSRQSVDAAALAAAQVQITLPDEGPQILILHTHACEAYTPDGTDVYQATDPSRTLDTDCNMVRIGREMKAVFEEMGLRVVHDETLYDYPSYNAAYPDARAGVERYLEEYPSIQIVLDVHRDALIGADGTVYKAVTEIDGLPTAQVELVMGSNDGANFPNWLENLALAFQVEKSMNTLYPTLARPIVVRSSHYNQFLSTGSLLVEVGCHGNTLQEAVRGARLFARAAGQVLVGLKE